eukprot:TRINITY_DN5717_c0_g2_i1.p6 TRINITY_DN5717_c0_g2~~TRINITY_DN5717_c0_g2_i1.p6  ORF type:complete len:100 (-),score=8.61 TRINITY_DN5717_c0_g2_i1:158-457(-)
MGMRQSDCLIDSIQGGMDFRCRCNNFRLLLSRTIDVFVISVDVNLGLQFQVNNSEINILNLRLQIGLFLTDLGILFYSDVVWEGKPLNYYGGGYYPVSG